MRGNARKDTKPALRNHVRGLPGVTARKYLLCPLAGRYVLPPESSSPTFSSPAADSERPRRRGRTAHNSCANRGTNRTRDRAALRHSRAAKRLVRDSSSADDEEEESSSQRPASIAHRPGGERLRNARVVDHAKAAIAAIPTYKL